MAIHELKIWSEYFHEVKLGLKKAEFRRDVDRRFNVGDVVRLIEIKRCDSYENQPQSEPKYRETGSVITCFITSVVVVNDVYGEFNRPPALPPFVMFSFHVTGMEIAIND